MLYDQFHLRINFQEGPANDVGETNGCQLSDVIAVCITELRRVDAIMPCDQNDRTLDCLLDALDSNNDRTAERTARGVEGTRQP